MSRNDTFDVMLRRNERLRSEAATYFGMYKMAAAERDELRKQRDAAVKDNKRLRTRYLFEEALPAFLRPQAQ